MRIHTYICTYTIFFIFFCIGQSGGPWCSLHHHTGCVSQI